MIVSVSKELDAIAKAFDAHTDVKLAGVLDVSRTTLGKLKNPDGVDQDDLQDKTLRKVADTYAEALKKLAGYGDMPPERKRQQLIGALHTMSDEAINGIYDTVLNALKNDMNMRYTPQPPPDPRTDRFPPDEDPGPRGGGTGGFDVNL